MWHVHTHICVPLKAFWVCWASGEEVSSNETIRPMACLGEYPNPAAAVLNFVICGLLFFGGLLVAFKSRNMKLPLCRRARTSSPCPTEALYTREMLTGSRVLTPPIYSSAKRALRSVTRVLKFLKEPLHGFGSHSSSINCL